MDKVYKGVFGSLGDGVAEVLAAAQQQTGGSSDSAKNAMQSLGQSTAYPFLKADSIYSAMPHISDPVQSSMARSQFYPFMAASAANSSAHLHHQQSAADSVFESLQHHNQISNMMANHSMSQLTSTMGSVAQQLHFADHMTQMMSYQNPHSAYSSGGQQAASMYATSPALSSLGQQWVSGHQASSNPFTLANPRATFPNSGADGAASSSQLAPGGASSSSQNRGAHSTQHSSSHHHHQAGASAGQGASSSGNTGILGSLSSASLAGLPTQLGMPGVSAATPDCDPRELEAFAERFKQRRIKLGVTQADVGVALGKLQIPGVGPLSQSTICRFESLTLSHNNMIALKPILEAWLDRAEKEMRERKENANEAGGSGKKRKRTSIPAPEKRSLEAYFQLQPRPSGEKIAQIADKLDLKKNVVRVWFCNQRQKQKRMKFAQPGGPTISAPSSSAGSSRSSQN